MVAPVFLCADIVCLATRFGNMSGVFWILALKQLDTIKFPFLSWRDRNARET
jgi:hypothetical protein